MKKLIVAFRKMRNNADKEVAIVWWPNKGDGGNYFTISKDRYIESRNNLDPDCMTWEETKQELIHKNF